MKWSNDAISLFDLKAILVAFMPMMTSYLRLAARESLGQPGVSPWYVDPAKIEPYLPSDEELADMPIEI